MPDNAIHFDRVRLVLKKPQVAFVFWFNVWNRVGCQCVIGAPTLEEFMARWLEITGTVADVSKVQRAYITGAVAPPVASIDPGAGE